MAADATTGIIICYKKVAHTELRNATSMTEDEELKKILAEKLRRMKEVSEAKMRKMGAQDKPIELTDATFKGTIEDSSLAVVDCWASWCAPCQMIAPVI